MPRALKLPLVVTLLAAAVHFGLIRNALAVQPQGVRSVPVATFFQRYNRRLSNRHYAPYKHLVSISLADTEILRNDEGDNYCHFDTSSGNLSLFFTSDNKGVVEAAMVFDKDELNDEQVVLCTTKVDAVTSAFENFPSSMRMEDVLHACGFRGSSTIYDTNLKRGNLFYRLHKDGSVITWTVWFKQPDPPPTPRPSSPIPSHPESAQERDASG